jgi:hypothetical protein
VKGVQEHRPRHHRQQDDDEAALDRAHHLVGAREGAANPQRGPPMAFLIDASSGFAVGTALT